MSITNMHRRFEEEAQRLLRSNRKFESTWDTWDAHHWDEMPEVYRRRSLIAQLTDKYGAPGKNRIAYFQWARLLSRWLFHYHRCLNTPGDSHAGRMRVLQETTRVSEEALKFNLMVIHPTDAKPWLERGMQWFVWRMEQVNKGKAKLAK